MQDETKQFGRDRDSALCRNGPGGGRALAISGRCVWKRNGPIVPAIAAVEPHDFINRPQVRLFVYTPPLLPCKLKIQPLHDLPGNAGGLSLCRIRR